MKTKRLLLAAMCFCPAVMMAREVITSPDGNLSMAVDVNDGKLSYCIALNGDVVIGNSPLGLNTTIGDFTEGQHLSAATEVKRVSAVYDLAVIKKSHVAVDANERTLSFADKDNKPTFDLVLHVDNNNVAFRYEIRRSVDWRNCVVNREATGFRLPDGATGFNCPQMKSQSGFASTAPSYESRYEYDTPMGRTGKREGIVFPALFRLGDKGWVMLCETGVSADYCASHLRYEDNGLYQVEFPDEREFGGVGTGKPGVSRTAGLPWRTVTVGRTLAPIAETTIMWDVVEPLYQAGASFKYGRATWSWIIRMDASCNYDEQKEYIDFAAAMGYEYVLIDALWDTKIGYDRMERLVAYAGTKGVGVFLWYNSNGYWNGAPQGPYDKMHRALTRHKEMAWLKKAGVKGLKIDFFGGDKQQAMQLYEDMLVDANEYGLMVIFHGCTIPRGWERMYPNFVSAEAVRASENLAFDQNENNLEAQNATILPLSRNAIGNMDFGGSTLNKHYSKDNVRGKIRRTSDVFALATAVLFQTPVQNFALTPNNMTDAPAWAVDFMKSVPVLWQDVKFIDGYPGRYLVMARKSADGKWYVAAVNARKETLKLKVKLPMLQKGAEVAVYSDKVVSTDAEGFNTFEGVVKAGRVKKDKTFTLVVPKDGAQVIVEK